MCLFGGNSTPAAPAAPAPPPEPAQIKAPDRAQLLTARGRRTKDQVRGRAPTILTGGKGITLQGQTDKKTLLGQ